jgi:hypothetical protein
MKLIKMVLLVVTLALYCFMTGAELQHVDMGVAASYSILTEGLFNFGAENQVYGILSQNQKHEIFHLTIPGNVGFSGGRGQSTITHMTGENSVLYSDTIQTIISTAMNAITNRTATAAFTGISSRETRTLYPGVYDTYSPNLMYLGVNSSLILDGKVNEIVIIGALF